MASSCPNCEKQLAVDAVLCIDCGYHLQLKKCLGAPRQFLGTPRQGTTNLDPTNPFSPVASDSLQGDYPLTEETAKRAKDLAEGALPIYASLFLSFCYCMPIFAVLLPLFMYRGLAWLQLYRTHRQLREPNSLSPFAEIEVAFKAAGLRYLASIILGLLSLPGVAYMVFELIRHAMR